MSLRQALTADARFPANGQHKAGDTWKLDPDVEAAGWATSGVKVRKEDVSGEAKLVSVVHENGVPWLSLQTDHEAKDLQFEDDPKSDSKSEPGSTRMTVKLVVPAALPRGGVAISAVILSEAESQSCIQQMQEKKR